MATVLVVGDAVDSLELLEREFRQRGYDVVSTSGGPHALAVAKAECPDVILLDTQAANLDAVEMCHQLTATPELEAVPVILVSAAADEEHIVRGLDAGAADFVTKPFSATILATRVRSALRRKQAYDSAQAAAQLRSEVLATTGDELRLPVANILEFANELLAPDRSEEERRTAINSIRNSGDRLLQIVNEIRDLSEIEMGDRRLELVQCSPVDIVADVSTAMRRHAETRGVDLHAEYAGPIPERIHSDPVRLRQILVNLVGNALKLTHGGGVRIRTQFLRHGGADSELQFEVIDTGIGICEQQVASLFRGDQPVDHSTTHGAGGTGLGLAISNQLAQLLGGRLSVTCVPGEGCTARLTVPTGPVDGVVLRDAPSGGTVEHGRTPARPAARLDECRILIAEDDPVTRKALAYLLTKSGARVTVAVDGPAAVGLALAADAAGSRFDVILMEVHLSALNGEAAIELLRKRGYAGPIVGLTSPGVPNDAGSDVGAGCDDLAARPIDQTKLIETVGAHVQHSRRRRQAERGSGAAVRT